MIYHWLYHGEDPFWPTITLREARQWLPAATDRLEVHTSDSVTEVEQWSRIGFQTAKQEYSTDTFGCIDHMFSQHSIPTTKPVIVWRHCREGLDLLADAIWRVNRAQSALQFLLLPEYFPLLGKEARGIGLCYQELGIASLLQSVTDLARISGLVRRFWQICNLVEQV
jgi:hypothetical protein